MTLQNGTPPTFPLSLAPTQSSFIWKKDADLPVGTFGAKGVLLEDKLYLGGGDCKDPNNDRVVYEYDINGVVRKWTALPSSPVAYFSMENINGILVLLGGLDVGKKTATSQLTCWDKETQRWSANKLPAMHTARQDSSSAAYKNWVLVAGGINYKKPVYDVELLDKGTLQWHRTHPMPKPSVGMTSCVVKDTWYLIGGTNFTEPIRGESGPKEYVFSLTMDENIATNTWATLAETPLYCCTAVSFGDHLMSLGGTDSPSSNTFDSSMFLFSPVNEKWMYVGNMPSLRSQATAVVMSKGEMVILGGKERSTKHSKTVEVLYV